LLRFANIDDLEKLYRLDVELVQIEAVASTIPIRFLHYLIAVYIVVTYVRGCAELVLHHLLR